MNVTSLNFDKNRNIVGSVEQIIYHLKNERNNVAHDRTKVSNKDIKAEMMKLKVILLDLITCASQLATNVVAAHDVIQVKEGLENDLINIVEDINIPDYNKCDLLRDIKQDLVNIHLNSLKEQFLIGDMGSYCPSMMTNPSNTMFEIRDIFEENQNCSCFYIEAEAGMGKTSLGR